MRLGNQLNYFGGIFDWDRSTLRLSELNALVSAPEFWGEPIKAQEIMRERTYLEKSLADLSAFDRDLQDTIELIKLGEEEGDANIVLDGERVLNELLKKCAKNQLEALLSGELDSNDCYLEIHAGAGGTEAQDWAEMLLRMSVSYTHLRAHET